jgi:hypothetical protein
MYMLKGKRFLESLNSFVAYNFAAKGQYIIMILGWC